MRAQRTYVLKQTDKLTSLAVYYLLFIEVPHNTQSTNAFAMHTSIT